MALFLHMLPGHVVARLLDCVFVQCKLDGAPSDKHSDVASSVLVWALLAVAAAAAEGLAATDDFCELQAALVARPRRVLSKRRGDAPRPASIE